MNKENDIKSVVLFAAMDKEIDLFLQLLQNKTVSDDVTEGELFCRKFYIVKTGIACFNSVFSSTKFLSQHKVDLILNVGCVGAHKKDMDYGDIVVADGFFGIDSVVLHEKLQKARTDEDLTMKLKACFEQPVTLGTVSSGDIWRNKEQIEEFTTRYDTVCEDMEGYYLASVAEKFNTPFVSVKFVSNNELVGKAYKCDFFPGSQRAILNALEKFFSQKA